MIFISEANQFAIGINEDFCFYWFSCGENFQSALRIYPFVIGVHGNGYGFGLLT